MSKFNEEKFLKDYTERYNKSKQGQAQSASVTVNSGFDEEKFLSDYTKRWEAKKAADYAQNKKKTTTATTDVKTEKQAETDKIKADNYNAMQELFAKSEVDPQTELDDVNRQIQAISGYGVGADRSNLQNLLQRKDELEKQLKTGRYDEDLNFAERLTLTAQGIGESYDAAAGVLVDTAVGAAKDHIANKGDAEYDATRKGLADVTAQINAMQYRINNGFGNQVDMAEYNRLLNQQAQLEAAMNEKYRTPMNMDSDAVKAMQRAQQAQQQATYGMGNKGAFIWNTGASVAENASMLPLSVLPGGQAAVLGMMGAKAAAQKAVEVGEKGGTAGDALLRGLGSGAIEAATERLPLEALADLIKGDVGKSIIKNMLKQASLEAGEEAVAYMGNLWLDIAAKDPNAQFSLKELGASVLAGAISGGVFGGGASIIGRNNVANTNDGDIATDNNVGAKDTDVLNKKTNDSLKASQNEALTAGSGTKSSNLDSYNTENEQLSKKEQLKADFAKVMGIDTRTETEKTAQEQQSKVAMAQEWADKGIAPQEDVEQLKADAVEKVQEAAGRQINLDYQKIDTESGAVREKAINSGYTKVVERIEKFAAKRQLKVKFFEGDKYVSGFQKDGTIYINVTDPKVMYKTAIHETLHGLRSDNQAEYESLKKAIFDAAGKNKKLFMAGVRAEMGYVQSASESVQSSVRNEDGTINRDAVEEEVIAKMCEELIDNPQKFVEKLNGDRTAVQTIIDFVKDLIDNVYIEFSNSEKAQMKKAVKEAEKALTRYMKGEAAGKFTVETVNADGEAVTVKDNETGTVRFNVWQYREGGGRKQLENTLKKQKYGAEDVKRAVDLMDDMAKMMEDFARDYATLMDWNNTEVVYDDNGRPVYSAMVKNGDYPINIDLSTICKKRIALQKVLNKLVKRNLISDVSLSPENIATINKILKENGYETQCPACFVESKRYNIEKWANDFADKWNEVLLEAGFLPTGKFDFSNGVEGDHFETMDVLNEDLSKADEMLANIGQPKRDENGNILYKKNGKPQMYQANSKQRIVMLLRDNPQLRKLFSAQDLIGTEGIKNIKSQYPEIYSLILTNWGVATPKIVQTTVPYNNEVAVYKNIAQKSKYIGGVRMFSFSDFTIDQVFDYVQVIADLYAQKAMMHTYTKEIAFAKLFGTTGVKINLSYIPAIDESAGRENAGLDATGELIYSEWGVQPEEAEALMADSRYSANLTPVMIGVSDNHIAKLLDTDSIRYIIPYHKSSLNPVVAKMTDIGWYKDYSDVQATRHADGTGLTKAENKKFDFYKTLEKTKDARKAADAYLEWCDSNGYIPKFEQFRNHKNYYKLLADYNLYDAVTGEYVPQKPVTMNFPAEFGEILGAELKKQADLNAELSVKDEQVFGKIVDAIKKDGVKFSVNDVEYLELAKNPEANEAKLQKMVEQAAREAGYKTEAYHGTVAEKFTVFDWYETSSANDMGRGHYFTTDKAEAERYAGKNGGNGDNDTKIEYRIFEIWSDLGYSEEDMYDNEYVEEYNKIYDQVVEEFENNSRVVPAYLKLENPYVINENDSPYGIDSEALIKKGYDGIIDKTVANRFGSKEGTSHIIVFDSNQIKSADPVTYDDNGDIIPLSERFNEENADIRFSINPNFEADYDKWVANNPKGNNVLFVGTTSKALKSIGVKEGTIKWDTHKIRKIKNDHPEITDAVIKQVPELLENPIIVMESKTADSRITMFGEVYGTNGLPVMAVLELEATNVKGEYLLDTLKVVNSYTKDNNPSATQNLINNSRLLYIEPNKNRTNTWLKANRLQLPFAVKYGPIGKVSYSADYVKAEQAAKTSINTDDVEIPARYEGKSLSEILDMLIDEHGAIEQGENPAREIEVPKKDVKGNVVSKFARTVAEAEATPDDFAKNNLLGMTAKGQLSHEVVTDKMALQRTESLIRNKGWDEALADWKAVARNRKAPDKYDIALGQMLYNNAVNSGDIDLAQELVCDLCVQATRAGQTVQAFRLLKKLTPEGRLYMLQKSVDQINAELLDRYKADHKDIEIPKDLAEELLTAKDTATADAAVEKIEQHIADNTPVTIADKFNAWRYLAMLGNPRTHIRNVVGNAMFSPFKFGKDALGVVLEKNLPKGEKTKAIVRKKTDAELFEFARKDFEGNTDAIKGEAKYNAKNNIKEKQQIFKNKYLEKARRFNAEWLEKEDEKFLETHYIRALAGAMKANGITARTAHSAENEKVMAAIKTYATNEAQKATYRDVNAFSKAVQNAKKALNKNAASSVFVEGILPFARTPANVIARGVEYSPVGIVRGGVNLATGGIDFTSVETVMSSVKQALKGVKSDKYTTAEALDQLSAGLTGTAICALGYILASFGLVKGKEDDGSKEGDFEKLYGMQDYALMIGGTSYTIDWAAPAAMPFFVGVELYNACSDTEESSGIVSALLKITDPVFEMSMLDGINNAIEATAYTDTHPIIAMGISSVLNYAGQAVPTLAGQFARTGNKYRTQTYIDKNKAMSPTIQRFVQQQQAKIPGLNNQLSVYRDQWGRKQDNGGVLARAAQNFASPGYWSTDRSTEVDNEIKRIYDETGNTAVLPSYAAKEFNVNGKTKNLTSEEYDKFAEVRGQTAYECIEELLENPNYELLSTPEQVGVIEKVYEFAQAKAKAAVSDYVMTEKERQMEDDVNNIIRFGASPKLTDSQAATLNALIGAGMEKKAAYKTATTAKNTADTQDNGSVNQEEAIAYLDSRDFSKEQRKILFDFLCPSAKTNPYE